MLTAKSFHQLGLALSPRSALLGTTGNDSFSTPLVVEGLIIAVAKITIYATIRYEQ